MSRIQFLIEMKFEIGFVLSSWNTTGFYVDVETSTTTFYHNYLLIYWEEIL